MGVMMSPAIGIDFGTENCRVAVLDEEDGKITVIKNRYGNDSTPSYISFWKGATLIGEKAKALGMIHPESVVCDVLQLLGNFIEDPELQKSCKFWPFEVVRAGEGRIMISVENGTGAKQSFHPEELAAMLLREMKKLAEDHLGGGGTQVTSAVITIPNYFTHAQRGALLQAARIAGLEQIRFIPSTAAASIFSSQFAKQLLRREDEETEGFSSDEYALLFASCLGRGNWDTSIFQVSPDKQHYFEIFKTWPMLGSQAYDRVLANEILKQEQEADDDEEIKPESNSEKSKLFRLLKNCEKAKELMNQEESGFGGGMITDEEKDLIKSVSRIYCEKIEPKFTKNDDTLAFNRFLELNQVLIDESLRKEGILSGGMSANPEVFEFLQDYLQGWNLQKGKEKEEAHPVVRGAALFASANNRGESEGPGIELFLRHEYNYKIMSRHDGSTQMIYLTTGPFNLPAHFGTQLPAFEILDKDLELEIYEELGEYCSSIGNITIPLSQVETNGVGGSAADDIRVELDLDIDCRLTLVVSNDTCGYKATFTYPEDFEDTHLLSEDKLNELIQKVVTQAPPRTAPNSGRRGDVI